MWSLKYESDFENYQVIIELYRCRVIFRKIRKLLKIYDQETYFNDRITNLVYRRPLVLLETKIFMKKSLLILLNYISVPHS